MEFRFDSHKIHELQTLIYAYLESNPSNIDALDVQARIRPPGVTLTDSEDSPLSNDNLMLRRLLMIASTRGNVASAFEKFKDFFTFRATFRISRLISGNFLPVEFYQIQPFIVEGTDRLGNQMMILRIKFFKKIPQFDTLSKHLLLLLLEQQDLAYEKGTIPGLTLILDLQDFSYRHLNLDMVQFILDASFKYAGLIRRVIIYELAWALSFLLGIAERFINSQMGSEAAAEHKILVQANKKNLGEWIAPEETPDFMAGGEKVLSKGIPEGTKHFLEMVKEEERWKGVLEEKNILKINEYVQSLI